MIAVGGAEPMWFFRARRLCGKAEPMWFYTRQLPSQKVLIRAFEPLDAIISLGLAISV